MQFCVVIWNRLCSIWYKKLKIILRYYLPKRAFYCAVLIVVLCLVNLSDLKIKTYLLCKYFI